jgi:bifunctional UDP-N-acetylglucosamine pyrophosphorylase/glucosamine-1-phosphate N-acetyltransferase
VNENRKGESMNALLLAAGKGIRLMPLTKNKPKCLVELNGKPLIEWILLELKKANVKECFVVVSYKKEKVKEFLGKEFHGIKINYINQPKPIGTGDAVKKAKGKIKRHFLCLNADSLFKAGLIRRILRQDLCDALIVAREEKHPENFGVIKAEKNKVMKIIEKPDKPESNLVNAGIYLFSEKIFDALQKAKKTKRGEIELIEGINKLIKQGKKVEFIETNSKIYDISSVQDLKKAEKELK